MARELKIVEIMNKIEKKFENDESKYLVFRGLPNERWGIESSAARRLRNNKQSYQADFIKYHKVLLDEIKKGTYKGINDEELQKKCDLEILAQIQHLGGATCLTDFSSNLLIALWFATEPHKENDTETDAKLCAINLKSFKCIYMLQDVMNIEGNYENSIVDLLTHKCKSYTKKQHFWYWKPRTMNGRINNQNSIFIFGLAAFPEDLFEKIEISHDDKSQIRQELREYFGISVNTVYPDLMGFSVNANNHNAMFNAFFSMNCMDIASSYLHEKNYKDCERYINNIRNCKKEKCDRRGTDKCNINKTDIEYLSGKCLYLQTTSMHTESSKNNKVLNYNRLINCYKESIQKLSSAITAGTNYAFDCMCTLIECYYNIVLCKPHFLEEDNSEIFDLLLTTRDIYLKHILELRDKKLVFVDKSEDLIIEFSILELSIFSKNDKVYKTQISRIVDMHKEGNMYINSYLLLQFFEVVGNYIFEYNENFEILTQNDITYKINKIKKQINKKSADSKDIFSFSVNWDFEDMRVWLSNHFKKEEEQALYSDLQMFCNEIEILQDDLKLAMFEKEVPFEEDDTKQKELVAVQGSEKSNQN